MPRSSTAFLLALLLLAAPPLLAAANTGQVLAPDDLETGTYVDLASITVTDNTTHLIITANWAAPQPLGNPTNYQLGKSLWLCLDLDNNRKTGCCPGEPWGGYEAELHAYLYADGAHDLYISFYASNGSWLGGEHHSEWLEANASSMTISIPLSKLNITKGDKVMIQGIESNIYVWDWLPTTYFPNYTVAYGDIAVDGDPSDWPSGTLLGIDGDDGVWNPYHQEFNMTAIYIATDNEALYLRLDLGDEINTTKLNNLYRYFEVWFSVDVDNDGNNDYHVSMRTWEAYVYNYSSDEVRWYHYSDYNVSWYGTTSAEFGLNLSAIGIENGLAGNNLTIWDPNYYVHIRDDYKYFYWAWQTRVFYTIGSGGHVVIPMDGGSQEFSGFASIHVGNATLNMSSRDWVGVDYAAYDGEPVGNSSINNVGYYYALRIDDPNDIEWPITLAINYSGWGTQPLGVYFYNASSGEYEECSNTWIDPDNKIVYANITMGEYLAGDEPVFVARAPQLPAVGGRIIGTDRYAAYIGLALITVLSAAVVVEVVRKRV